MNRLKPIFSAIDFIIAIYLTKYISSKHSTMHAYQVHKVCSLPAMMSRSQKGSALNAWFHAMSLAKIANYVSA